MASGGRKALLGPMDVHVALDLPVARRIIIEPIAKNPAANIFGHRTSIAHEVRIGLLVIESKVGSGPDQPVAGTAAIALHGSVGERIRRLPYKPRRQHSQR
jgi:hypothetical protein